MRIRTAGVNDRVVVFVFVIFSVVKVFDGIAEHDLFLLLKCFRTLRVVVLLAEAGRGVTGIGEGVRKKARRRIKGRSVVLVTS